MTAFGSGMVDGIVSTDTLIMTLNLLSRVGNHLGVLVALEFHVHGAMSLICVK